MDKKLYYTGILAYTSLLVLAVVFFKERAMLLDNSLFLFDILRTDTFTAPHSRFIAVLPQVFAVLAMKLALPLKWVMVGFSFGFTFYHAVCYLVTGLILKNYRLAIAMLLANSLIVTHTFYWQISELLLGISMIFPVFALMMDTEQRTPKLLRYVLLFTGVFFLGFSHPLVLFPYMFTFTFFWLSKEARIDRKEMIVATAVYFIMYACKKIFFTDEYESAASSTLKNIPKLFPNYFSVYSNRHFVENWFSMYYWLPVLFVAVIFVLIRNRRWLHAILVAGACIGYSQLINISYPKPDVHDFYIENMYQPLCVFLAIPLVYSVFPKLHKGLVTACFLLIVGTSLYRIIDKQAIYEARLAWFRSYLDKYEGDKMLVPMGDKPVDVLYIPMDTPYEFWLLSTLERNKTASILIHDNVDEIGWAWSHQNAFVTTWGVFPYKDLNPRYFKFTDTLSPYGIYRDR